MASGGWDPGMSQPSCRDCNQRPDASLSETWHDIDLLELRHNPRARVRSPTDKRSSCCLERSRLLNRHYILLKKNNVLFLAPLNLFTDIYTPYNSLFFSLKYVLNNYSRFSLNCWRFMGRIQIKIYTIFLNLLDSLGFPTNFLVTVEGLETSV